MLSLKSVIKKAEKEKKAVGHFNISELAALKAIAEVAAELGVPVIIGTSEGERDFIDPHKAVALVRELREEHHQPVFINADHTRSLDKVKEAVLAGYDAILFDGGKLPLEENIRQTKEVFEYVKNKNPKILVEGELGFIGSSSEVFKELPKGAALEEKDLTTSQEASEFVKETGVDLLAPAVGNIHGMLVPSGVEGFTPMNPPLNIKRIQEIKAAVKVPLVLHGGSGTRDSDFLEAIHAGVSIIHINTEIRVAWRHGLEKAFKDNPEEVTPYKLMKPSLDEMKKVVYNRLKLFNRISE